MPNIQFSHINTGTDEFITVFVPGQDPLPAGKDHPNFAAIVAAAAAGDESVIDLFDVSLSVAEKFDRLSERVSVANGRVYFDGDVVDNALTAQVVRFLNEGVEDWRPLVNFFEKVQSNPNGHSRTQLYNWLSTRDFTITPSGDIVGYKGVHKDGDQYLSIHSGDAIVDGVRVNGQVPNAIGSVIEMARSGVQHDPSVGCHRGLHVGTWDYASSFAQGAVLEVHVNPRDVVSVPTDCDWQKVRCCRYQVVKVTDVAYTSPVLDFDGDDLDDEGWDDGSDW